MNTNMTSIWNNIVRAALFAALLFAGPACRKQDPSARTPEEGELRSRVVLAASDEASAPVKSAVTSLKPSSFGIVVVEHQAAQDASAFAEYLPFLSNIATGARGDASDYTSWNFRYDNSSTVFSTLYLISKKDGSNTLVNADVYAYAPHIGGRTPSSITSVPFTLNNQNDVMWAQQNLASFDFSEKGYNNRNIVIDGTDRSLRFDFHHVLALVQLEMSIKNTAHPYTGGSSGNTRYYLTGFKIHSNGSDFLPSGGSLNALTGTFTPDDSYTADFVWPESRLSHPIPSDGTYSLPFNVLLCPVANEKIDYQFEFELFTQEKGYLPHASFHLTGDLLGGSGLQGGKKYTIKLTFDNYVHFDGVTVTEDWTDVLIEYGI